MIYYVHIRAYNYIVESHRRGISEDDQVRRIIIMFFIFYEAARIAHVERLLSRSIDVRPSTYMNRCTLNVYIFYRV